MHIVLVFISRNHRLWIHSSHLTMLGVGKLSARQFRVFDFLFLFFDENELGSNLDKSVSNLLTELCRIFLPVSSITLLVHWKRPEKWPTMVHGYAAHVDSLKISQDNSLAYRELEFLLSRANSLSEDRENLFRFRNAVKFELSRDRFIYLRGELTDILRSKAGSLHEDMPQLLYGPTERSFSTQLSRLLETSILNDSERQLLLDRWRYIQNAGDVKAPDPLIRSIDDMIKVLKSAQGAS